ncbi:hypothetical protein EDB83DRAFT_1684498 [Lactarius deliciosus]|nr:hypothetical protein EDB83DRAFT_1684498 [Lactarius deliciosus]
MIIVVAVGSQHEGNEGIESGVIGKWGDGGIYGHTFSALDADDDGTSDRVVDKKGGHDMRYIRLGVVVVASTLPPRRATVIARVLLISVGVAMYWPHLASVGYPGRGGSGSGIGLPVARGRGRERSSQGQDRMWPRHNRGRKPTSLVAGIVTVEWWGRPSLPSSHVPLQREDSDYDGTKEDA